MNFLDRFSKTLKYQIPRKCVQWEPCCSTRTDTTKLMVAFLNLSNAPKRRSIKLDLEQRVNIMNINESGQFPSKHKYYEM